MFSSRSIRAVPGNMDHAWSTTKIVLTTHQRYLCVLAVLFSPDLPSVGWASRPKWLASVSCGSQLSFNLRRLPINKTVGERKLKTPSLSMVALLVIKLERVYSHPPPLTADCVAFKCRWRVLLPTVEKREGPLLYGYKRKRPCVRQGSLEQRKFDILHLS